MLQHFEWRHQADLFLFTIPVMKNYLQLQKQVDLVLNTRVSKRIRLASGPVDHSFVKDQTTFLFTFYQTNPFVGLVSVKKNAHPLRTFLS